MHQQTHTTMTKLMLCGTISCSPSQEFTPVWSFSLYSLALFSARLRCGANCGFLMHFLSRQSTGTRRCVVLVHFQLKDIAWILIDYQGGQDGHGKVCLEDKLAPKEKKEITCLNRIQQVVISHMQLICSAQVVSVLVCMFITQIVHPM